MLTDWAGRRSGALQLDGAAHVADKGTFTALALPRDTKHGQLRHRLEKFILPWRPVRIAFDRLLGTNERPPCFLHMDAVRLAVQLAQHVADGGKYRDLVHAAILARSVTLGGTSNTPSGIDLKPVEMMARRDL